VAESRPYPGFLIAFEGPEGDGRREALAHARGALQARGQDVVVSRPMGATLAGAIYRSAAPLNELSPRTLVLVAASDMAERLEWEILPALQAGKVVLADRYVYRTIQGMARDLDPDWLEVLCAVAPRPDLVFLFHEVEVMPTKRSRLDLATVDLYEAGMDLGLTRDVPFSYQLYQQRVLEGYEDWAESHQIDLLQPTTMGEMVDQIESLVGIEVGDLNVRHQAVLNMLHQHYHDPPHAMQTATLALQLFDQLRPLHGLPPSAAELFEFGVLLHNVGDHGEERDRHVRTAALIRESNLPGFTPDELNIMGVLAAAHTIHHQRELEAWLATVPSVHRPMVEKLAPLARLADGMDASHEQTVRWVEAIIAEEGKLLIRMQSRTKAKQEVHATRERSHLIERIYGLEVEVIAERQGPPPATTNLTPLATAGTGGPE
jgi:dTMP kinase